VAAAAAATAAAGLRSSLGHNDVGDTRILTLLQNFRAFSFSYFVVSSAHTGPSHVLILTL
jgi:hypothetical protein